MELKDFDSKEELEFYAWLYEAESYNLVSDIQYHERSYRLFGKVVVPWVKQLKTKTKDMTFSLFQPHVYTPDFEFWITDPILNDVFKTSKYIGKHCIVVDVKGGFQRFGGQRSFSLNRKWMWQKHGIYIEAITPEKLFRATWVPEQARITPKTKKPVQKYIGAKTITKFIQENK